jgi:hypothetical protein
MHIPPPYSQRDARWSGPELGYNTDPAYTIYHFGCAVAAASNIIAEASGDTSWDPYQVNRWLIDNGGFAKGGGLIIWDKLAQLLAKFNIYYHGYSTDLAGTNRYLQPENAFAIAQLTKPGFPMHFSAMPFVGYIADSWDAKVKPVTTYTFVGAHLYSWDVPVVAAPALSPAPVQAPVIPPAIPVPSATEPVADPNPPAPLPVAPEWVTTYKAWEHPAELTVAKDGAYAFDPETGTKLMNLPRGDIRDYAGSFLYQGVRMIRGKAALDAGKWSAVSESYFTDGQNYTDGPAQVTHTTPAENPADPLGLGLPELDEQTKATFLQKLWEPIAWLFAVLLNKKGIK